MRPDDLPSIEVLGGSKPHGTRLRYMAGCKCMLCRAANSRYETERAAARKNGDWNGLVSAVKARRHLLKLSRAGVGRRSVADSTDCSITVIQEIKKGRKSKIRARTERKILAVPAKVVTEAGLVDAEETWIRINRLLGEGFTKSELAHRLGYKMGALQIATVFITARNERRVQRFHDQIMAGHRRPKA